MKFVTSDSEQVFAHASSGHDSKPFEPHNNSQESTELKLGNGIIKEYQNGAFCSSKAKEGGADHLPYVMNNIDSWNATKHDCSLSLNELAHDNGKDVRNLEKSYSHSCRETESFEDSIFYMDKNVTECKLPELIVCYKENTYHVKDICIDEGLASQERILFETDVDEKEACVFLSPKEDRNNEPMDEKKNTGRFLSHVLKSSAENGSAKDIADQHDSLAKSDSDEDIVDLCDSNNLMPNGEVKDHETDKIENNVSKNFFSLGDLRTKSSSSKSSNNNDIETEKESFQGSSQKTALAGPALVSSAEVSIREIDEATLVSPNMVIATEKSNNEKEVLGDPALVSTTEESNGGIEEATLVSSDLVSASEELITEKAALVDPALISAPKESNVWTQEVTMVSSDLVSAVEESKSGSGEVIMINPTLVSATKERVNGGKEAISTGSDVVSASEGSVKSSIVDKLSYNSRVETGSITFNFGASASAARGREECLQNGNSGPIETPQTSRLEDTARQAVSSLVHSTLGESSFSMTGPSPELISYSGPVAYSGNLSLRSDSSTTSTRSFAFPILQSEWNSSPVRMAKADRRHYRKQKCWGQSLLCCRF